MDPAELAAQWQDYHKRRNAWVAHNFPTTDGAGNIPMQETCEGLIEEIGELAHANLKAKQNIRGTQAEHEAAAKDAIGDMTVYLWGITARQPESFIDKDFWGVVTNIRGKQNAALILEMATSVGNLSANVSQRYSASGYSVSRYHVACLIALLMNYCQRCGWDYHGIVAETWTAVEKRDWQRFPGDGLTK
jgi:NTP pyrophosphatase (non-canonical NTP hydrolase)